MARDFNESEYLVNSNGIISYPYTFAFWFNPPNTTQSLIMMGFAHNITAWQWSRMSVLSGGGVNMYMADSNSNSANASTSTDYSANTWQHACAVHAAANDHSVFLDGGGKGTSSNSVSPSVNNACIGGLYYQGNPTSEFHGYLAEAAIWGAALTDAEVAVLANGFSPRLMHPESLLAYWPLIGRTLPEIDIVGGYDMDDEGSAPPTVAHPPMLYAAPKSFLIGLIPANPIVDVNTLVLASTAVAATVVGGDRSVNVNALTLAGTAVTANVFVNEIITVNTLALAGTAITSSVQVGAVTVVTNTLDLVGTAISLSVDAPLTIAVNTLTLAGSAVNLLINVALRMDTLTLAGSAQILFSLVNIVTPTQLGLLRSQEHEMLIWGSVLVPDTIWTARVNEPTITRGTASFDFDVGSGTDFSLITATQEVWIGTSAGAKDVTKLRIRSISSGDGGVTGTLEVSAHRYIIADNHYLTFKFDYPIRQKFPLLGTDGTFYKDRDIAYTDENAEPDPVCICGTDRAGWLDPSSGNIVFDIDVSESYATAEGASITSYSLTVLPSAGSSTIFDTGTGIGSVTFTTTGQRWVRFSAADSNGKSQFTFRSYWVHDPDPNGADHPMFEFSGIRLNGDWERGGWNSQFQVNNDASLTDLPDEARILLWAESKYDNTTQNINILPPGNYETIFNGFLVRDTTQQDLKTGAGTVNFEIHTPHEILRQFNLGVSLEVVQGTPATWWQYEEWMTTGRAIHHLWKHHSTIFRCIDVLGLMDNTIPKAFTEFDEGDLFSMADTFAFQRSIRSHIVCDVGGRIHLTPDLQLLTDGERQSKKTILDITMDDLSGQIELRREPINKVAFVKVSGFMWDGTTFITDANNEIVPEKIPICASAPGLTPAYEGESIHVLDRQNFVDQNHANQIAGRVYAQENNEYRSVPLSFHGNYYGVFDVAYDNWYTMSLQAGDTPRGIIWTDKKLACRSVSIQFDTTKGSAMVNASFEAEMDAIIGLPAYCLDDIPDYGGEEPEIEDEEAPDALVTGGSGSSIYFKSGYGSSWSQRSTDAVEDLVQDPFWPNKQSSTASNDAILINCGYSVIQRSIDGGQTWDDVTPSTNPPNDAGDSPAPTARTVTYSQIDSSWTYLDEFVAMATWQNSDGDWRTWLYYTDDNFATGSWQPSLGDGDNGFNIDVNSTLIKGGDEDEQDITRPWNNRNYMPEASYAAGYLQSLVRLTDTKSVVLYTDIDSTNPDHSYYCKVVDILEDDSLDVGPEHGPINYYDGFDWHFITKASIFEWSSTEFILLDINVRDKDLHTVQDPWDEDKFNANSYYSSIRLCSVSGSTITFGTRYEFWTPVYPRRIASDFAFDKLPGSNDDGFLIFSTIGGFATHASEDAYARVISKTGTGTLSLGTQYQWEVISDWGVVNFALIPFTDSIIGILYTPFTNLDQEPPLNDIYPLYTKTATIGAGSSLSFTSRVRLITEDEVEGHEAGWHTSFDADRLTDTKAIITYKDIYDNIYAATVSRTGTTLTVEDWQIVQDPWEFPPPYYEYSNSGAMVSALSDSKWLIWMAFTKYPGPRPISVGGKIGYLTGTYSHEYGPLEYDLGAPIHDFGGSSAKYMSDEHVLVYFTDFMDHEPYRATRLMLGHVGSAYDAKGLGLSIGKGAGDRVYVTISNGWTLELLDYDLPALTLYDAYNLGPGTIPQADAGVRVARPFAGLGDDDWIVVYGRMEDPYGLGNNTYVLESEDGGFTAILVQTDNTWDSGYCGALWMEPNGFMYAIRNLSGASKLYYGNPVVYLSLMATLTFPSTVKPHGLKLDPYTLAIYASASTPQSQMIIKAHPFYTRWTDMTYDHGTSSGINSLELL